MRKSGKEPTIQKQEKKADILEDAEKALALALGNGAGDYETFRAALQVSAAHSLLSIARSLGVLAECIEAGDNEHFAYRVFVVKGDKK